MTGSQRNVLFGSVMKALYSRDAFGDRDVHFFWRKMPKCRGRITIIGELDPRDETADKTAFHEGGHIIDFLEHEKVILAWEDEYDFLSTMQRARMKRFLTTQVKEFTPRNVMRALKLS